jgi:glutathione S-transferase
MDGLADVDILARILGCFSRAGPPPPPEKRNHAAIAEAKAKAVALAKIFDAELAHHAYVGGDAFSMGDIPMGIRIYRFRQRIPDRPALPHMERCYAAIEKRPAYHEHVGGIPLT